MSSFKKIIPVLNRIVVKKIEPLTKTASGIIVQKPEKQNYAVVLEVGPGAFDQNGKILPLTCKVGDTVLLPEYGGNSVKLGDQNLDIYRDTDIIAKVE